MTERIDRAIVRPMQITLNGVDNAGGVVLRVSARGDVEITIEKDMSRHVHMSIAAQGAEPGASDHRHEFSHAAQ